MLSRVSELQQQLFQDRPQAPTTPGEPLKLQRGSVAVLAAQLKHQFQRSGIFYEQQLRQWLGEAIPLKAILQQPQNSNPSQRQELLFKQFELIQTGIYRFEFALDEQRLLFGAIQPDIHPLLQQFRQGKPSSDASPKSHDWTCELFLQDARHGDFKLRLRMESRQLHIELQGEVEWMQLLQKHAQGLQQRLRQQRFSVASIQFRSAADET
ncbi:hypothetical protein CWI71_09605 [Pseudidiomarina insulisalsae]|uniref:Uncharacterized protein n=2 Tax=Pseudidiomarina insulisalsae TaxID=575789 RepID=A0A432YDM1_9GAMM|nr:hypothetical protein CWI71_09605 [Pseudidiomarina insulisalsae]